MNQTQLAEHVGHAIARAALADPAVLAHLKADQIWLAIRCASFTRVASLEIDRQEQLAGTRSGQRWLRRVKKAAWTEYEMRKLIDGPAITTARQHGAADWNAGRDWFSAGCKCDACNVARASGWNPWR